MPGRIFPPSNYRAGFILYQERASGEGIASALGKLGAIIATFIIPPLLQLGGGKLVLIVAIAVLVLGGVITLLVGPLVLKHLSGESLIVKL